MVHPSRRVDHVHGLDPKTLRLPLGSPRPPRRPDRDDGIRLAVLLYRLVIVVRTGRCCRSWNVTRALALLMTKRR